MYSNFKTESSFQGYRFFQCVFAGVLKYINKNRDIAPLSLKNESTLGISSLELFTNQPSKEENATC